MATSLRITTPVAPRSAIQTGQALLINYCAYTHVGISGMFMLWAGKVLFRADIPESA